MVIAGGMRSLARFAELIVPFMGLAFVGTAVIITLMNIQLLPSMFMDIFSSAFGLNEADAGALGAAIKNGIQRVLYSNEAGAGSVPHAAAGASPVPNHPVAQGYVQMLGVFLDTMVLCSCTAVVANYAYAESNVHLFKLDNKMGRLLYTSIYLTMVFGGANASLKEVWGLADMALGLMTLVNIYAIFLLTPTVVNLTKDFRKKLKINGNPTFLLDDVEIQGKTEPGVWFNNK